MSIEPYLIEYCSPTLARLKSANLFRISFSNRRELEQQLLAWNRLLGQKGVQVFAAAGGGLSGVDFRLPDGPAAEGSEKTRGGGIFKKAGISHLDAGRHPKPTAPKAADPGISP